MDEWTAAEAPYRSVPETPTVARSGIPEVEHYELDGIPLFFLPMPGPTVLTLAFGVGRADEPVIRGGMTHLAEHLVMTAISDALDHGNGTTEPFRVTFTLRGTPEEASRFLRDVCGAIEKPRFLRIHEEARVLQTEAAARQAMGLSLRLIWFRTGYQGLGTASLPELFLRTLDPDALRAWMAEHFTAGNAAIWIAGELPDDLYVSLPPGPHKPPAEVRWIPGFETPTLVVDEGPGVGASFFVERSTAIASAFRTLGRNLRRALRVDRGLGYEVGGEYVPVSPDHALITIWATCLPAAVRDVERIMLETIDDLAARGPTDEDLAEQYQRFLRSLSDPMAMPGRLDGYVRDVLLGRLPEPLDVILDEQWRMQSSVAAAAFRRAYDSMLLLVPPSGTDPQRPFKPYPVTALDPVGRGSTFEIVGEKRRLPWARAPKPRLTVGDGGLAIDASGGRRLLGLLWENCVAIVQESDGWSVVGRDGTTFQLVESDWRGGRDARNLIGRVAPPNLIIPLSS